MSNTYMILAIAVAAVVTAATRFLPFLIFGNGKKTPEIITYLGKVLPYAIMGMLVVYCMKDVSFTQAPFGAPEIIACAAVAILHIWRRNTLLSIAVGTIGYMLLVQFVF